MTMNRLAIFFSFKNSFDPRLFGTRITADGKDIPKYSKSKNVVPKITLISPDNNAVITDLKNAQSLAQRRDLKLVKIEDINTKTQRPVYKLLSNSEYHEEELKRRKERQEARQNLFIKGEKLLTFSTKIGEHDLITNIKKMVKHITKQYEVRVIITLDSSEDSARSESMYTQIEKNVKDLAKVVQKRSKGNSLKFQLLPMKAQSSNAASNEGDPPGDKGPL